MSRIPEYLSGRTRASEYRVQMVPNGERRLCTDSNPARVNNFAYSDQSNFLKFPKPDSLRNVRLLSRWLTLIETLTYIGFIQD